MTQYVKVMKDDELAHFGVPGMKWGKRKNITEGVHNVGNSAGRAVGRSTVGLIAGKGIAKSYDAASKFQSRKAKAHFKDAENLRDNKAEMLKLEVNGKKLFTTKEIDDLITASEALGKKSNSKAQSNKNLSNQLVSSVNTIKKQKGEAKAKALIMKINNEKKTQKESADEWREIASSSSHGKKWLDKQLASDAKITQKNIDRYQKKIDKINL